MASEKNSESALFSRVEQQSAPRPIISLQGARVPPNATDIEEMVLGALLIEPNLAGEVNEFLQKEHFYDGRNALIYESILKLQARGLPVDSATVTQALSDDGTLKDIGGVSRIVELTMLVSSAANTKGHVEILIQKYLQRELIRWASETQAAAYSSDEDVEDILEKAEKGLFDLHEYKLRREMQSLEMALHAAFANLDNLRKDPSSFSGVPTGFLKLDSMTQGWQKGDLIILAARPSVGKTAFALSMARTMTVEHKKKVAFFSLEMPTVQLVNRLLSSEARVDAKVLRSGRFADADWAHLLTAMNTLSHAEIYLDDTSGMGIGEIRAKARRLKSERDIDIVMIDYLQLISSPSSKNGNREQEVSKISRGLKALAKELNIPVLALSQMSRAVDARTGDTASRPLLSDLRESGAIEQDADIVLFISRPEKNGIGSFKDTTPTKDRAELIIAKHRNGEVGSVFISYDSAHVRFYDTGDMVDHNNPDTSTFNSGQNYESEGVYPSSSNPEEDLISGGDVIPF